MHPLPVTAELHIPPPRPSWRVRAAAALAQVTALLSALPAPPEGRSTAAKIESFRVRRERRRLEAQRAEIEAAIAVEDAAASRGQVGT